MNDVKLGFTLMTSYERVSGGDTCPLQGIKTLVLSFFLFICNIFPFILSVQIHRVHARHHFYSCRVKGQKISIWTRGAYFFSLFFQWVKCDIKVSMTVLISSSREQESTAQCPSRHVIIKYYITSPAGRWYLKLQHPGSSRAVLWFRFFFCFLWLILPLAPTDLSSQHKRNNKKKGE